MCDGIPWTERIAKSTGLDTVAAEEKELAGGDKPGVAPTAGHTE